MRHVRLAAIAACASEPKKIGVQDRPENEHQDANWLPSPRWLAVLVCGIAVLALPAFAPTPILGATADLYWVDNGADSINRIGTDGSGFTCLLDIQPVAQGLAIDTSAGKMYWADNGKSWDSSARGRICRSNLDGTEMEVLFRTDKGQNQGAGECLHQIALDVRAGHLYFTEGLGYSAHRIGRMNLDGTTVVTILSGSSIADCLELDPIRGQLYFITGVDTVERCDLGGGNRETVLHAAAYSLGLDVANELIYGADWGGNRIWRAAFDGTGMTNIDGVIRTPRDVQQFGDHLFYSDLKYISGDPYSRIIRSDLDGSNAAVLYQVDRYVTPSDPIQLVIIPEPASLSLVALGALAALFRPGTQRLVVLHI
ncbi:MAG: hypothetical protein NTU94_07155 [Planctomycetota bacterium]|nr:hypothetical protein [Planctomycetota bacterium]